MGRIIILTALCLIIFTSCNKKDGSPGGYTPPTNETDLEVVWKRYFNSDKSEEDMFLGPVFWNNHVIVSNSSRTNFTNNPGLRVLNKQTGVDHHAWNNEPGGVVDFADFIFDMHIGGSGENTLFIGNTNNLYAVNLNTGRRSWKASYFPNFSIQQFSMLGNTPLVVYMPTTDIISTNWRRIAKYDVNTGDKTDVFEVTMEDNYEFLISNPAWTLNSSGDTLMFFMASGWNFYSSGSKMKAYCFNLTSNEMVWEKDNFSAEAEIGFYIPSIINNNKVVFQTSASLFCFDILNGQLIWNFNSADGFFISPALYRDDRIYVRNINGLITVLNDQSGSIIWKNTDHPVMPSPDGQMDIYEGKLYVSGRNDNVEVYLYCMSAETGEILWRDKGPSGRIRGNLIIDQNTGYLYCTNESEIICIDLNRSPKEK